MLEYHCIPTWRYHRATLIQLNLSRHSYRNKYCLTCNYFNMDDTGYILLGQTKANASYTKAIESLIMQILVRAEPILKHWRVGFENSVIKYFCLFACFCFVLFELDFIMRKWSRCVVFVPSVMYVVPLCCLCPPPPRCVMFVPSVMCVVPLCCVSPSPPVVLCVSSV